MSEKIYGSQAVLEALKSGGKIILGVYLLEGAQGDDLEKIKAYAWAHNTPVSLQPVEHMKAMSESGTLHDAIAICSNSWLVYRRWLFSRYYYIFIIILTAAFLILGAVGFHFYFLFLKK